VAKAKMKSKALQGAVIIALLLAAAIIALPFIVNMDRFRPEIESRLTGAFGREVKLGNLRLSLLSGGVKVDDITIADNPAFNSSPFLVSKSFRAGVELKPLIFSKEVRLTEISLDRPEIVFVRSSTGEWNFSDLGRTTGNDQKASGERSRSFSEAPFSIRQVKIIGGRIAYIKGNQKPSIYEDVNLVVHDFSPTSSFPFTLTASLPGGGRLNLAGKAGPLHQTDTILTPVEAELDVSDFDLSASGFVSPDSGISGILNFKGSTTSDGRWARSEGQAEANGLQLAGGGAPALKPIMMEYLFNYDLASRRGALSSGEIQIGRAVARMNMDLNWKGKNLVLKMRVLGTEMPVQDLVSLLPAFGVTLPGGASLEGGSLDIDITTAGSRGQMLTTVIAELTGTRLTGFDLAGKMAALASLTGIQSSNVTDIETLTSRMHLTPKGIYVNNVLLIMPSLGRLSGSGRIDNDQSLDLVMRAAVKPTGPLGSGLGRLLKRDTLNIPFFIRGTSSDPKFVLDTKGAGGAMLEDLFQK